MYCDTSLKDVLFKCHALFHLIFAVVYQMVCFWFSLEYCTKLLQSSDQVNLYG